MPENITNSKEIKKAFIEYDRKAILNNVIVGCLLGAVLMPVGTLLDYFVYHKEVSYFLKLRLLCSLLIIFFGGSGGGIHANWVFFWRYVPPFLFHG